MGFGRWLIKTVVPGASTVYKLKNIVDEGSVIDGMKRTVKEDICEDNPVTSTIYRIGKDDGKKDGYVEASQLYEEKYRKQAALFFEQKVYFASQKKEYEDLLDAYELAINELEAKQERTEEENECLRKMLSDERKLKNLKIAQ